MILAVVLSMMMQQTPAPAPVNASTKDEVEALYAEGAALFRAEKYRLSIAKFEAAYNLFPDPKLLYNAARAYEALGELGPALERYKTAASHPQATPELRGKAAERMSVVSGSIQAGQAAKEPANQNPTVGTKAPGNTAATTTPAPTPVATEEEGSVLPWVAGGLIGVAVIGGGIAAVLLIPGPATASTLGTQPVAGR
jgi:hypothetical protein